MGAPSFSLAFGERVGAGNPQPEGRHNRSPASGETQCVPLWEIVVTFVLRNAFSPRPCSDPQNRMGSAGVSLQRCECPPALCSRDSERLAGRGRDLLKSAARGPAGAPKSFFFGYFSYI